MGREPIFTLHHGGRSLSVTTIVFELVLAMMIVLSLETNAQYAAQSTSYFPLSMANEWTFTDGSYSYKDRVVDTARMNGRLYYGVTYGGTSPHDWFSVSFDSVFVKDALNDTTETLLYNFAATVGDTLLLPARYSCSFGRKITLVSKTDTVTTPAGTFFNCYHVRHFPYCMDDGIYDSWFATGIGRIKFRSMGFNGWLEFSMTAYSIVTSIGHSTPLALVSSTLLENYPNPFNPTTTIRYSLRTSGHVKLTIYDVLGQVVAELVNREENIGTKDVHWDATGVTSGIYFYRLEVFSNKSQSEHYCETKKMVLVR
jgi:hypothetical protein